MRRSVPREEDEMRLSKLSLGLGLSLVAVVSLLSRQAAPPILKGPYMGQKPPGSTPELFARGVVSTPVDEYAFEVSPSGDEMLFAREGRIMLARMDADGTWHGPAVAPFSGKDIDGECCFSPDGARIFFTSRRPLPGARTASNVWVSERTAGGWGKAMPFGKLTFQKEIHAPSVAASGTIYESGLVRFMYAGGKYSPAEPLTPPIDGRSPFVAPDESYIIFARTPPGRPAPDLHITFRKSDGTWTAPIRLDDRINSPLMEVSSFVTADGKYLFFTRKFDVYWVSAEFIEKLRIGLTPRPEGPSWDWRGWPGRSGPKPSAGR